MSFITQRRREAEGIEAVPEDYTTWHQRHFDNGKSVSELGEKIKKFVAAKRQTAMVSQQFAVVPIFLIEHRE